MAAGDNDIVTLSRLELDLMLKEAGRAGASEALSKIGLDTPEKVAMFSDMQGTWKLFSEMRRGLIKRLLEYLAVALIAGVTYWVSSGGFIRIGSGR